MKKLNQDKMQYRRNHLEQSKNTSQEPKHIANRISLRNQINISSGKVRLGHKDGFKQGIYKLVEAVVAKDFHRSTRKLILVY